MAVTEAARPLTAFQLAALYREGDVGDPWGTTMGWLFAVADALYWHHARPELIPDIWGFRPSPFGPATEASEYDDCCAADPLELAKFGAALWRKREVLKEQGRDY